MRVRCLHRGSLSCFKESALSIKLSHIGEPLVAQLLESLNKRGALDRVRCARTGRSLSDDIQAAELEPPVSFRAVDATLVIHAADISYDCDGEQKVDVLCTGGQRAIAIEVKLGESRMGRALFLKRFGLQCEQSKHAKSSLRGSMVAVLERSFQFEASRVVAKVNSEGWEVATLWWLVVRRRILDTWLKSGIPVTDNARLLVFESLADTYGTKQDFDKLVSDTVGSSFADAWGLGLRD